MLETHGYNLEEHKVKTEDGYILTLLRIPHGKNVNDDNEKSPAIQPIRPAVLLVHGFAASGDLWFLNSPDKALPFLLADAGYDCWVANLRGTLRSTDHTTLSTKSKKFWDFSLHEMGTRDIPAMIDYILIQSGNQSLSYIGHSMGCTMACIALSTKPEYCSKIKLLIALAPAVFLKHLRNKWVRRVAPICLLWGKFGSLYKTSFPSSPVAGYVEKVFPAKYSDRVLKSVLKQVVPMSKCFGKHQMEKSDIISMASVLPSSTSAKLLVHMVQQVDSGKCQQFNYGRSGNMKKYGQCKPPTYDISKVNVPVVTFTCDEDYICDPRDVTKLANELPNVLQRFRISQETFHHGNFVVGKNAGKFVYPHVLEFLEKSQVQSTTWL